MEIEMEIDTIEEEKDKIHIVNINVIKGAGLQIRVIHPSYHLF